MVKRKKKSSKIVVKYVKYDNKGRKGDYAYIKEKGVKPTIYKRFKGLTKKDYLYAYQHKLNIKRGGVKKEKIKKEKRLDKISKKYPKVDTILKRGYAGYTIKNVRTLTPRGIRLAYMKLLMNKDKLRDKLPIVRDKDLLDLITRNENVEKWKRRIMYQVVLKNEMGDVLSRITNVRVKSLANIKKEILDNIKIGKDYQEQYRLLRETAKKGYKVSGGQVTSGKVSNIQLRMVFRKGSM